MLGVHETHIGPRNHDIGQANKKTIGKFCHQTFHNHRSII
jgi:hypothetical protein